MKSTNILIRKMILGAILLGLTTVNAAADTATTAAATPAKAAPAAAAAAPTPPPANVNSNAELQKCMDEVTKDSNGAPNGMEMRACTQQYGNPTNIPALPKRANDAGK